MKELNLFFLVLCIGQIFINVGILLGYTSNYALAGLPAHLAWRIMYAIGVLPPVLLAVGVLAMPESPEDHCRLLVTKEDGIVFLLAMGTG